MQGRCSLREGRCNTRRVWGVLLLLPVQHNMIHLATAAVQAALKELGNKVPEHLKVELPPGAEAAKQATGSAALATVLERSRRQVAARRQSPVVGLASAGVWAASAYGWQTAAVKRPTW